MCGSVVLRREVEGDQKSYNVQIRRTCVPGTLRRIVA